MNPVVKDGLVLLGGVVAASVVIAGVEYAGHAVLRGDLVFAGPIAAYFAAALVGGVLAALFAPHPAAVGFGIAGVLALLTAINVMSFTHPAWFLPAAIAAQAAGAFAGLTLMRR